MIYRVRTGNKTGTSWKKVAARRAGRGKKGLAAKHHRSARDPQKHPHGGWLDQQRRGIKMYAG